MSEAAIRELPGDAFERVRPIRRAVLAAGDTDAYPAELTPGQARAMWTVPPARCLVAEADGEVPGRNRIAPNQLPGSPGDPVANGSSIVAQAARGRGVGEAPCRHSLEQARQAGFAAMPSDIVVGTNAAAIRMWQRCGLEIVGRLPGAFRHPRHGALDRW